MSGRNFYRKRWQRERKRREALQRAMSRFLLLLVVGVVAGLAYGILRATTVTPAPRAATVEYRPREVRPEEFAAGQRVQLEATAYTAGFESTGKQPGDPEYGITASGAIVEEWHTAAAGPSVPFGTRLYIPEFADKPNGGWFVVEDRGSAITDHHVDIYMPRLQDALDFGRRPLTVYIVTP